MARLTEDEKYTLLQLAIQNDDGCPHGADEVCIRTEQTLPVPEVIPAWPGWARVEWRMVAVLSVVLFPLAALGAAWVVFLI